MVNFDVINFSIDFDYHVLNLSIKYLNGGKIKYKDIFKYVAIVERFCSLLAIVYVKTSIQLHNWIFYCTFRKSCLLSITYCDRAKDKVYSSNNVES